MLVESEFMRKETLPKMVTKANVQLRHGAAALLEQLDQAGVPLVILSAGYTQVGRPVPNLHRPVEDHHNCAGCLSGAYCMSHVS